MKKLMILGGSRYAIPVIQAAKRLEIFTITADYLPDNIAHKYSDEYVNVSIIDKEATLAAAQRLQIDGIVSFGCDPGVVTAAYVAEKMGLPFQGPYKSVEILQDKGLFRQFLAENGFNVPHAKRYTDKKAPFADIDFFTWPVIVKPVDSAGSKGVTKVDTPEQLPQAVDAALHNSIGGSFIIEDFLVFEGYHSTSDIFVEGNQLKFVTYMDHQFAICFSSFNSRCPSKASISSLERLASLRPDTVYRDRPVCHWPGACPDGRCDRKYVGWHNWFPDGRAV